MGLLFYLQNLQSWITSINSFLYFIDNFYTFYKHIYLHTYNNTLPKLTTSKTFDDLSSEIVHANSPLLLTFISSSDPILTQ
jgi:hypothetical protein